MSQKHSSAQLVRGETVTRTTRQLAGLGKQRVYTTADEAWYPSVSTINEFRPDPGKEFALRNWRRTYNGRGGREHHRDIKKVKSYFGTLAHYYVLTPFATRDLWGEAEATAKRELQEHGSFRGIDAWGWACTRFPFVQTCFHRALRGEEVTDVLGVEQYVLDRELGYGGQYDLLYTRAGPTGDETVLCDLKTGSGIRHNYELQLAAYAHALEEDVDCLKIVRAHPDRSHGEFEVHTDADFADSWADCFDEFRGYVHQFHAHSERVDARSHRSTDSLSHQDDTATERSQSPSPVTEDTETSAQTETTHDSRDSRESQADDNADEPALDEQVAASVEKYTGSPYGMGRMLRKSVDDQEIPQLIANDVGGVPAHEQARVLDALDALLPAADSFESHGNDAQQQDTPAHDHQSVRPDADAASTPANSHLPTSRTDQVGRNADSAQTPHDENSVALASSVVCLLERAVETDDRFANSRETVIETALKTFLRSSVGGDLNPTRFEITETPLVAVDCDSILGRLLDAVVATNDRFAERDDVATTALLEFIGITTSETVVTIDCLDRYQMFIDSLIANEAYPCETTAEVVQAALESYLLDPPPKQTD